MPTIPDFNLKIIVECDDGQIFTHTIHKIVHTTSDPKHWAKYLAYADMKILQRLIVDMQFHYYGSVERAPARVERP